MSYLHHAKDAKVVLSDRQAYGHDRVAYADDHVMLVEGDSLAELDRPCYAGAADVVIGDPPRRETSLSWDRAVPSWLPVARRLLKPTGSVWFLCSLRCLLRTDLAGWRVGEEIVWEKHNGSGSSRASLNRVHELAVQLVPVGARVYRGEVLVPSHRPFETFTRRARTPHQGAVREHAGSVGGTRRERSVVRARSMHRIGIHPTEKPRRLVEVILRASCPPGGMAFDLFAGSGVTLRAARSLGMRAIGAEIDGDMARRAARTLIVEREPCCEYCDEPGATAFELRGDVSYFHPDCVAEMKENGSCSGEDEPFEPLLITMPSRRRS